MMRIFILALSLFFPAFVYAQSSDQPIVYSTETHAAVPSKNAYIAKYTIDKTLLNPGDESGNLHILYSDGTEIIEKIPLLPTTQKTIRRDVSVHNQKGIAAVAIAKDKRTIGWSELFDNCCTSYALPLSVAIYHSGKTILHIQQGQVAGYWTFLNGGKNIAIVWGAAHGPEIGDYQLYDTATGKMLDETFSDASTQSLKPDAPTWAKETEIGMHARKTP